MEITAYRVFHLGKKNNLFSPVASLIEPTPRFKIGEPNYFEAQTDTYEGFYCFINKSDAQDWDRKFPNTTIFLPVKIGNLVKVGVDNANRPVVVAKELLIDKQEYLDALNGHYAYSSFGTMLGIELSEVPHFV